MLSGALMDWKESQHKILSDRALLLWSRPKPINQLIQQSGEAYKSTDTTTGQVTFSL